MKKKWLVPLLALSLLASCAPAPEGDRAEFDAFTAQIDAERSRDLFWTEEERALVRAYTPDRPEQADDITEAEFADMRREGPPAEVGRDEAKADVETYFRVLRTAYGGYEYFGGDAVFLPIRDRIMEELDTRDRVTRKGLKELLLENLSPVLTDGHINIGYDKTITASTQYMYYVPDVWFSETEGQDMDYVKRTIGPDGALAYCFAALSHDGSGLPGTAVLSGETVALNWEQADRGEETDIVYQKKRVQGLTVLVNSTLTANGETRAGLQRLAGAGGSYRGLPAFAVDLRRHAGGNDMYAREWVEGFTGRPVAIKIAGGQKYSYLYAALVESLGRETPEEPFGTWEVSFLDGARAENDSVIFVLMDKGTASAGEDFISMMRTLDRVVLVGSNTRGGQMFGSVFVLQLPNTRLNVQLGTNFHFWETTENREGAGILPDLWVDPPDALDAVVRLCGYYGLN